MQQLPANPYELSIWSEQTILLDYTVTDGLNKYSVPYDLIGEMVSVRMTRDAVEVFFNGNGSLYIHEIENADEIRSQCRHTCRKTIGSTWLTQKMILESGQPLSARIRKRLYASS